MRLNWLKEVIVLASQMCYKDCVYPFVETICPPLVHDKDWEILQSAPIATVSKSRLYCVCLTKTLYMAYHYCGSCHSYPSFSHLQVELLQCTLLRISLKNATEASAGGEYSSTT